MKIKFHESNHEDRSLTHSQNADKENRNISNQKAVQRSKRQFGKDITHQANQKYNLTHIEDKDTKVSLPVNLQTPRLARTEIAPYQEEILDYIIHTHENYQFTTAYKKKCIGKKSKRGDLVEYLYKIYKKHKLRRKTFHLSVYYMDRYLQQTNQTRNDKLMLVVQACMLIAMKYEEIYPPYLTSWVSGSKQSLMDFESKVLKVLDFKLAYTTAQHYLEIYEDKNRYESKQNKELMELIIDLYALSGQIYKDHPLKIVQQIRSSFRQTNFLQKDTHFDESDKKVKQIILNYSKSWNFLLAISIQEEEKRIERVKQLEKEKEKKAKEKANANQK